MRFVSGTSRARPYNVLDAIYNEVLLAERMLKIRNPLMVPASALWPARQHAITGKLFERGCDGGGGILEPFIMTGRRSSLRQPTFSVSPKASMT